MINLNTIVEGDCLVEMKHIEDNSIDTIITDPPYGIDFQSAWRTDKTKRKPKIVNDKAPFIWFLLDAFRVLKEGGRLLCFTRYDTENDFRWAMNLAGFTNKAQIIWDKGVHGMGDLKGDFASRHENIIYATKGRYEFKNKRPKSVIKVQRVDPNKLTHPNEKPVELIVSLIESISEVGDIVLDPFAGSGTTLMAAMKTGRSYIGIELTPEYIEIINKRLLKIPEPIKQK